MKEWLTFSKYISIIICCLLIVAYFIDCFPVIQTFFVLSFMTFLFSLTTIFTLIVKKNGLQFIVASSYIDIRRRAIRIASDIYNRSLPPNIIREGEEKMSKRLRKIRECLIGAYVSSWWMYLSPNNNFETLCRSKISRVLESLADRFKDLNYSQLILAVIRLKVGMARSKSSNSMRKLAEIDQEKYFASAIFAVLPKLLDEEDVQITELREFLSEIVAVSVLVPFLDLAQSPAIIFNSVIALLVQGQDDIAEYVTRVQELRRSNQLVRKDTPIIEMLFLNDSLHTCSSRGARRAASASAVSLTKKDQLELPKIDSVLSISNLSIVNTVRNTDIKSNHQYTVYVIKFSCTMTTFQNQITTFSRTTQRRYREFVNLHNILSDLPDYKGIRGPSSLDQMFFHNFSPARITIRKDFLESYLKNIITKSALLNNVNLQKFLGICQSSADTPFENITTPFNAKIKKKWNLIKDKISDKFPDSSKETHSDRDETVSDRDDNRNVNGEGNDSHDEINKMLSSLSKLSCHQNPAFPTRIPEFEDQHSLIQVNIRNLTDNYMLMSQCRTADIRNSSHPNQTSNLETPSSISINNLTLSPAHRFPISYTSGPIEYGPNDPVPFLLSFRLLAMQYRNSTCRNWQPTEGPVLTRTGGFLAKWEKLFWQILGCPADAIIQWSFEDLLRASYVADYLELFQELLWPSGKSSKSLATFAMNADPVHLRQAATQSIVDALPKVTFLFVNKDELVDLIDAVLSDFQDSQCNRLFLFQLLQIIIEEHLFRDVFNSIK